MSAYDILVKVGGDITGFSKAMENANKSLKGFTTQNQETFDAFKKTGAAVTGAGVAISAGLGVAVKQASDFQSAFAGVRKTVDATEDEFAALEKGIREMAKVLPASAEEIAGVAEAAGQLGIEKKHILDFSRTMIDLGESTNMTADIAATEFARFANVVGMSQGDFDKLGSVVVDLGNNLATTEAEIVSMAMRLAGAGSQIGMSESDIMALAGSLSSVGIAAEMGGSAISKAMISMQVATSTGFTEVEEMLNFAGMSLREVEMMASHSGKAFGNLAEEMGMTKSELQSLVKAGTNLEDFSKISGMTAEEFKKAFEEDAMGALGSFISGLGNAEEAGESAINMLQEMGITEVRLRDALLRAGNASELFAGSVEIASNAWEENTALTDEATQRYKTFESKMSMFKNAIKDVGITIGNVLLPIILALVEKLSGLLEWVTKLNPSILKWTTIFAAAASAILLVVGPILLLIGFIPAILAGFAAVKTVFLAVGTAVGAISWPIILVVGIIVGLIATLRHLWKTNEGFRDAIIAIWGRIQDGFKIALEFIMNIVKSVITEVFGFVKEILGKIKAVWDNHGEAIKTIVVGSLKNIWEYVKLIMGYIKGLFQIVWPIISGIVKVVWGVIKTIIRQTMDVILGIIDAVMYLIRGDWEGAWESIKATAVKIMLNIVKFFKEVDLKQIGKDIINGLIKGILSMASAAGKAVKNIASNIKGTITKFFGIKSPSKLFTEYGVNLGEGLAIGMTDMKGAVTKSAEELSKSAVIKPDLTYTTPNANYGSLSAALSGEVNVNQRDSMLVGAIASLEQKLSNLRVDMDGKTVGAIVAPTVSESINAQADSTVRGRGRRRI